MRCTRGGVLHRRAQDVVLGQRAVVDGLVDAREVLLDHRAGAEVEVPDLGVAHLALGQARPPCPRSSAGCADSAARGRRRPASSASETALPGPCGAIPQPSRTTRQTDGTVTPRAASTMAAKSATSSEAPPTSAPSTSGSAEQLGGVVGLDRAAVEDPRALGLLAVAVGHQRAHEGDRVLGLLGRGHEPGADGPDRLVGDDDVAQARAVELLEALLHLVAQLALGVAGLALVLGLADAEDRLQAGVERGRAPSPTARGRSRCSTGGARSGRARRRGRRARRASAPRPRR